LTEALQAMLGLDKLRQLLSTVMGLYQDGDATA
jgi:hypothetical protein